MHTCSEIATPQSPCVEDILPHSLMTVSTVLAEPLSIHFTSILRHDYILLCQNVIYIV